MKGTGAWFMLLLLGVFLVIIGFQGSVGKVFAVAFAPAILEWNGGTTNTPITETGGQAVGPF